MLRQVAYAAGLALVGALAAVTALWLAGPKGTGWRLPEVPAEVRLDLAGSLAEDPSGTILIRQQEAQNRLEQTRVSLQFEGIPFERALLKWAEAAGVDVVYSETGLERSGRKLPTVVLSVSDQPADVALSRLLESEQHGFEWFTREGVVYVVRAGEARRFGSVLRVYDVRDLILHSARFSEQFPREEAADAAADSSPRAGPGTEADAVDRLIEVLQSYAEDGTSFGWETRVKYWGGRFVVYGDARSQLRVRLALEQLRDAIDSGAAPEGAP